MFGRYDQTRRPRCLGAQTCLFFYVAMGTIFGSFMVQTEKPQSDLQRVLAEEGVISNASREIAPQSR
jgi:hypothetical protein